MKKFIIVLLVASLFMVGCSFSPFESGNETATTDTASVPSLKTEGNGSSIDASCVALITDFSDSVPSLNLDTEYDFADEDAYKDVSLTKNLTVDFNGSTYSGQFERSDYRLNAYSPSYIYISDEAIFYVDSDGTLTSFALLDDSKSDIWDKVFTKEECIEVARQLVSKYISTDELSQYTVSIDEYTDDHFYYINFRKYVNGLETYDSARVQVTFSGQIVAYYSFMLGEIPYNVVLSETDIEAIKATVISRIEEIYEPVKDDYDEIVHKGVDKLCVIKLKDGGLGVTCSVTTDCCEHFDEGTMTISEIISFVIPITD